MHNAIERNGGGNCDDERDQTRKDKRTHGYPIETTGEYAIARRQRPAHFQLSGSAHRSDGPPRFGKYLAACWLAPENSVIQVEVPHPAASATARPTPATDKPPITDASQVISRRSSPDVAACRNVRSRQRVPPCQQLCPTQPERRPEFAVVSAQLRRRIGAHPCALTFPTPSAPSR